MSSIEVIRQGLWVHSQDNTSNGGLISKVSECRWQGITFWVRENINGMNSFYISSGERWGDKVGSRPRGSRQTLEILAPKEHQETLKTIVHAVDAMHRPVKTNNNFNAYFLKSITFIDL